MKTNNNYLRTIANKLGAETMINRTNNYYLKKIFEKLGGTTDYHKSDNQYLKYISDNIEGGSSSCDVEIDWSINGTLYEKITSVTVPDGVTTLPNGFVTNLSNLKSITLPNTLTTINNATFQTCFKLIELEIPPSVTAIGYNTFPNSINCKFERAILNWTENPVAYDDNHMQLPNNGKAVFSIPKGTKSIYESANYPSDKLVEREE